MLISLHYQMITIRQAVKKDWPKILKLIRLYPKTIMQLQLPKVSEFFVAVADRKVIACCALEVYSRRIAEVRSLVVLPKFRGQGIAQKLIARCLDRAKKRKILEVLSITSAVKLFAKFGFRPFRKEKYALLKMF